jgi:hypothetical protein
LVITLKEDCMPTKTFTTPLLTALVALLAAAAPARATTVQGSLRYAGQPVSATFSTLVSGVSCAYDISAHSWAFGTASQTTNGYSVSGLGPGTYWIHVRLSATTVYSDFNPAAGDLYSEVKVTVANETTLTQDVDMEYAVHVTQPFDNATTWTGSCFGCPQGALAPDTFTMAWEAVPLATSYRVRVRRWSCTDQLSVDEQTVTSTSVEVLQRVTSDEEFILVDVVAVADGEELSIQPFVKLTDCSTQTHPFHAATTTGGRPIHPTNSRFLIQVAHLHGVAPTFWKSDLHVTNPTSSPVTATLTFTPRNADGSQSYQQAQLEVPANSCRTVTDTLDALFHASGAGSLEIKPATLDVASRCYTPGAGEGTYGQGYLPVPDGEIAYIGGASAKLGAGGVGKGDARTNLALVEVWGESVEVVVRLLDRDGVKLGETTVDLQPFGNTQINDLVGSLGGPQTLAEGQVTLEVTSGSGRVAGALSLVDNGSQDPTTIPLTRR